MMSEKKAEEITNKDENESHQWEKRKDRNRSHCCYTSINKAEFMEQFVG